MEDDESMDVDEILMEELDACDWDLSEDSMENIARKIKDKFTSYDEAIDYIYSMTTSMIEGMDKDKDKS